MLKLRIRWHQFLEMAREQSSREALRRSLSTFWQLDRIVVPVYRDLSALKPATRTSDGGPLEFLVVDRENAETVCRMNKTASRRLKGIYNTAAGYYAYAAVSGGEIVGDVWCAAPGGGKGELHPDLGWLGIECGEKEAYMFDMYVAPGSRGKVITSYLLGNALAHLKEMGFQRVYGFYEKENLPALWTHRMFGYTELANRKVSSFLHYRRTEPVSPASSPP